VITNLSETEDLLKQKMYYKFNKLHGLFDSSQYATDLTRKKNEKIPTIDTIRSWSVFAGFSALVSILNGYFGNVIT